MWSLIACLSPHWNNPLLVSPTITEFCVTSTAAVSGRHESRTCFSCSSQILLFLTFLSAGNLLHLKECLTKVFCLSPWNDGKCLAYGDVPILCSALIKRFGSGSRLGFKLTLNCRRHFFSRRINYHCNPTASFQLDNLALCGDVHPNPGHGNTSDTAGAFAGRKHPTWKHPLQTSPLKPKGHSLWWLL